MMFKRLAPVGVAIVLAACGQGGPGRAQALDGPLTGEVREAVRAELVRSATNGFDISLPSNAAELDQAEADHDVQRLSRLTQSAEDVEALLQWQKIAVFRGGGSAVTMGYTGTLWRTAFAYEQAGIGQSERSQADTQAIEGVKTASAIMALYSLALLKEDGLRCAYPDTTAGALAEAMGGLQTIFVYLRAKPEAERRSIFDRANALNTRTRRVRGRDAWLCNSQAARDRATADALASGAANTTERDDPSTAGRDIDVAINPDAMFVDDATWWSRVKSAQTETMALMEDAAGL